jgi:hypothetical protein
VAHEVNADIDADEAQDGVQDGEFEGLVNGESSDDKEIRRIADDEPGACARLRRNDTVT